MFWYTKETNNTSSKPDFYGRSSKFHGLAIVFDQADVKNNRYNPYVYAIENDGKKSAQDFIDYGSSSVHLGACYREIRNTPSPVFVKVRYVGGVLKLDVDIRQGGRGYLNCFEAPVHLPTGYYFGVSASTGDEAADDHDIHSFETYELNPAPKEAAPLRPHEKEDIESGHKFEFDDDWVEKINKVEHNVVENTKEEEKVPEAVTVLFH